jgi:cell division protein DivIC
MVLGGMALSGAAANRTNEGSKRRLRLWFVIIMLFMAWALYTFLNQMQNQGATEQRLAAIKQKIAEGEKVNGALEQKIERLNDPEYINDVARKEQGMIMPGEKQIQITEQGH